MVINDNRTQNAATRSIHIRSKFS